MIIMKFLLCPDLPVIRKIAQMPGKVPEENGFQEKLEQRNDGTLFEILQNK